MSMSPSLVDREKDKFVEVGGNTAVRITGDATGTFTVSGMTDFLITTLEITDVASKIPATPLVNRKSMSIYNMSTTDILYVGNSDVEANRNIGTTSGWEIMAESIFNLDFAADKEIWGIADSGKTIKIKVIEFK